MAKIPWALKEKKLLKDAFMNYHAEVLSEKKSIRCEINYVKNYLIKNGITRTEEDIQSQCEVLHKLFDEFRKKKAKKQVSLTKNQETVITENSNNNNVEKTESISKNENKLSKTDDHIKRDIVNDRLKNSIGSEHQVTCGNILQKESSKAKSVLHCNESSDECNLDPDKKKQKPKDTVMVGIDNLKIKSEIKVESFSEYNLEPDKEKQNPKTPVKEKVEPLRRKSIKEGIEVASKAPENKNIGSSALKDLPIEISSSKTSDRILRSEVTSKNDETSKKVEEISNKNCKPVKRRGKKVCDQNEIEESNVLTSKENQLKSTNLIHLSPTAEINVGMQNYSHEKNYHSENKCDNLSKNIVKSEVDQIHSQSNKKLRSNHDNSSKTGSLKKSKDVCKSKLLVKSNAVKDTSNSDETEFVRLKSNEQSHTIQSKNSLNFTTAQKTDKESSKSSDQPGNKLDLNKNVNFSETKNKINTGITESDVTNRTVKGEEEMQYVENKFPSKNLVLSVKRTDKRISIKNEKSIPSCLDVSDKEKEKPLLEEIMFPLNHQEAEKNMNSNVTEVNLVKGDSYSSPEISLYTLSDDSDSSKNDEESLSSKSSEICSICQRTKIICICDNTNSRTTERKRKSSFTSFDDCIPPKKKKIDEKCSDNMEAVELQTDTQDKEPIFNMPILYQDDFKDDSKNVPQKTTISEDINKNKKKKRVITEARKAYFREKNRKRRAKKRELKLMPKERGYAVLPTAGNAVVPPTGNAVMPPVSNAAMPSEDIQLSPHVGNGKCSQRQMIHMTTQPPVAHWNNYPNNQQTWYRQEPNPEVSSLLPRQQWPPMEPLPPPPLPPPLLLNQPNLNVVEPFLRQVNQAPVNAVNYPSTSGINKNFTQGGPPFKQPSCQPGLNPFNHPMWGGLKEGPKYPPNVKAPVNAVNYPSTSGINKNFTQGGPPFKQPSCQPGWNPFNHPMCGISKEGPKYPPNVQDHCASEGNEQNFTTGTNNLTNNSSNFGETNLTGGESKLAEVKPHMSNQKLKFSRVAPFPVNSKSNFTVKPRTGKTENQLKFAEVKPQNQSNLTEGKVGPDFKPSVHKIIKPQEASSQLDCAEVTPQPSVSNLERPQFPSWCSFDEDEVWLGNSMEKVEPQQSNQQTEDRNIHEDHKLQYTEPFNMITNHNPSLVSNVQEKNEAKPLLKPVQRTGMKKSKICKRNIKKRDLFLNSSLPRMIEELRSSQRICVKKLISTQRFFMARQKTLQDDNMQIKKDMTQLKNDMTLLKNILCGKTGDIA